MPTREDLIKETRPLYKTAFNKVLNKYIKIVYSVESDNYHSYDSNENYLGRVSPYNLNKFAF